MGKETYGSRHVSGPTKFSTRFFDVLGRAYDKMKTNIKYYVFKEAIESMREVSLEFDVWARIVKDENGDDIQMFIKKDEKRGFRKDSSFYHSWYWEVFEFDDVRKETRFKAASGIKSISKYDDKERLKEYYRIDGKGDTLESHRYEWKNGRLVRMTANGIVRNYIYGKTLRDTVRVIPTDRGFNFHKGYDGTAGKIPEEGTTGYETFSRNPYGHVYFGEAEEGEQSNIYFAAKEYSSSLNILGKVVTQGCIMKKNYVKDMPEPQCVRFQERDALAEFTNDNARNILRYGYPSSEIGPCYGMSYRMLNLDYWCECNGTGKYQPYLAAGTYGESIEVYLNIVRYVSFEERWQECFWHSDYLLKTYTHETKHIENARIKADNLAKGLVPFTYDTREKCENYLKVDKAIVEKKWGEWIRAEQSHDNPNGPTYSGGRVPNVCN
jgi:hypothetical protein